MNDYLKQSELSYFFSQHSMNNNNNAGKQAPSLYPRPKEDDSVFGGVWVQPEEEARKNALSITGTEIWGPPPQFPPDKNWDGKSGSSGSGRMSTTVPDVDALDKWGGALPGQQSDWNRRSNMSSSSEASLKETPPPLNPHLHDANIFMPLLNRAPIGDSKLPQLPMWKHLQQQQQPTPQPPFQPLHLQQQLQQQQHVQQQQQRLLMQLLQQKKLQGGLPTSNQASSLPFDPPWMPPNHALPKKLLDPVTVDLYKKIATHLNPSQQSPHTRSKMIQQLVSMGFKREDVGKTLMENDLDYDLTLGELVYKSAVAQGLVNNNNNQLSMQQQPQLFMQQQQQPLQQYLRSLVNNLQQQQQQTSPLLSMLNNLRSMPPFPSNQVPVDYTVQSLLSNQKKFSTSPSAFFQPASNNASIFSGNSNNSNLSSLFNHHHNNNHNSMPSNNNSNNTQPRTTPLLNPQSPEWTPCRADASDLTSMLSNMTLSATSPTWSHSTDTNLKPLQRSSPSHEDADRLNESSHYWLPADLTQTSTVLDDQEEATSAWVAINNLPGHTSKDHLAVVLCQFGVLKSLTLMKESNYALACFQDKQQAVVAKTELNSTGLQGDTRVHVEFVPDWTLDTPTFQSVPSEGASEKGADKARGIRSEMGYTTPGGLWIPNKASSEYWQFQEADRFNGDAEAASGGVGDVGAGVIGAAGGSGGVGVVGGGGKRGASSGGGGGLITGGGGSGGGGGSLSGALGGSLRGEGISGGREMKGQKEVYAEEKGVSEEEELKNLNFLFDEPYEGPLNKAS